MLAESLVAAMMRPEDEKQARWRSGLAFLELLPSVRTPFPATDTTLGKLIVNQLGKIVTSFTQTNQPDLHNCLGSEPGKINGGGEELKLVDRYPG